MKPNIWLVAGICIGLLAITVIIGMSKDINRGSPVPIKQVEKVEDPGVTMTFVSGTEYKPGQEGQVIVEARYPNGTTALPYYSIAAPSMSNGLIREYRFDDNATLLADSTGNSNGVNFGGVQVAGVHGGAVNFSNGYYANVVTPSVSVNDSFTMSFWANPIGNHSGNPNGVFDYSGSARLYAFIYAVAVFSPSPARLMMGSRTSIFDPFTINVGWNYWYNGGARNLNEWHHYIVQYNNGSPHFTIFYDGNATTSVWYGFHSLLSGYVLVGNETMVLGLAQGILLDGLLDDFCMWDRNLNSSEIAQLVSGSLQCNGMVPGMVVEWSCNASVWYPDKTVFIANQTMFPSDLNGNAYIQFTVPNIEGVYEYQSTCQFRNRTKVASHSFHVTKPRIYAVIPK